MAQEGAQTEPGILPESRGRNQDPWSEGSWNDRTEHWRKHQRTLERCEGSPQVFKEIQIGTCV